MGSDNPASRKPSSPAPDRYDLPGGYSAVCCGRWPWLIYLHGEPLRMACGDIVTIDGDGPEVRAFLAAMSSEVRS